MPPVLGERSQAGPLPRCSGLSGFTGFNGFNGFNGLLSRF